MTADEIRAAIDAKLSELNIEYHVTYVGEAVQPVEPPKNRHDPVLKAWEHDLWRVTFGYKPGTNGASRNPPPMISQEYRTGLGHRKPKSKLRNPWAEGTVMWEKHNAKVPQAPTAADVLYCLCSDAQAADQSFHDWASDLGFDTDSLKALNTYNECCKIGRDMRALFGRELEAISEIVREL